MAGQLLRALIEQAGGIVTDTAPDGERAVEAFRRKRPDLVFLDMFMPKMNGLEALRAIRHLDPEAFVVVISADTPRDCIEEARALGAQAFLTKPINLAQIRALFERHDRLHDQRRGSPHRGRKRPAPGG